MRIRARQRAIVATALLWSIATLAASGQQGGSASTGSQALPLLGPPMQAPVPPASEVTVNLRASVTFRDRDTAELRDGSYADSARPSAFDLLAGWGRPRPARGSYGLASDKWPFAREAWDTARVGEHVQLYAAAGQAGRGDLCTAEAGVGAGPAVDPFALWRIDARVVSTQYRTAGSDAITLDLTWSRVESTGSGRRQPTTERRTVVLSTGERHVIDFMAAPASESPGCANLILDVSASRPDDPATSTSRLAYDVWFVHKDRSGREWRQNQHGIAAQRRNLTALFEPVTWALSGDTVEHGGAEAALTLQYVAVVRAWVRPDGLIDLKAGYYSSLAAGSEKRTPTTGLSTPREVHPRGDAGSIGRLGTRELTSGQSTSLTVKVGETAKFILRTPQQELTLDTPASALGGGARLARGVTAGGTVTRINLEEFFAGTETSLIVTVRRR